MVKKKKKEALSYSKKRSVENTPSLLDEEQETCTGYDISDNVSQTLGEEDTIVAETESEAGAMDLVEEVSQSAQAEPEMFASGRESAVDSKSRQDVEQHNPGPAKVDYAGAVMRNRKATNGITLEDARPEGRDFNPEEIDIREGVVEDFDLNTAYYLIGHISGKFPGRNAITNYVKDWNCELIFHPSGWIVLKFKSILDRDEVLEKGPHYVYRREFLLHIMPELFSFRREEICKVPLWVKFPCLPLQLWNKEALSLIASGFGKPMYTDKLTRTRERISYARVLIEVDVSKEKKNSVILKLPNGNRIVQHVIYEFWPKHCSHCKAIGHEKENCNAINRKDKTHHNEHSGTAANMNLELENLGPAAVKNLELEQPVEQLVKPADAPVQNAKLSAAPAIKPASALSSEYGNATGLEKLPKAAAGNVNLPTDLAVGSSGSTAADMDAQHQPQCNKRPQNAVQVVEVTSADQWSAGDAELHADLCRSTTEISAAAQGYNSAEPLSLQKSADAAFSAIEKDNSAAPFSVQGSAEAVGYANAQIACINQDNLELNLQPCCSEQDLPFMVPKKKHRVKTNSAHSEIQCLDRVGPGNAEGVVPDTAQDQGAAARNLPAIAQDQGAEIAGAAAQAASADLNPNQHAECTEPEPPFLVPKKKHREKVSPADLHTENQNVDRVASSAKVGKSASKKRLGKGHAPSTKA